MTKLPLFITSMILFWFTSSFSFCNLKATNIENEKAVQLKINWQLVQIVNGDPRIVELKDSVYIITRDSLKIFMSIIKNDSIVLDEPQNLQSQENGRLYSNSDIIFHVFRNGDSIGITRKLSRFNKGVQFNVDSFLRRKAFLGMEIYSENDSLIKSTYSDETYPHLDVYIPKKKFSPKDNMPYLDSVYCFYAAESINTDVSFSKLLEQKYNKRLYKVVGIYNETEISVENPIKIPKRVLVWELRNVSVPFKQIIDSVIDKTIISLPS
ncbi:MAG: hypothetical protein J0M30_03555 [Chitinophagales bacterium]|nr:hypothetical protein [Chitinophagales bacterium]